MADVFISYKREERPAVERIATLLRDAGLTVWFDARLPSGQSFDEEINRELRAAKAVLVCWSPAAIASDWVRAEATIGRERDVLVAVMLTPTQLYPPFNLVHANDLTEWDGSETAPGWLAALARIGTLTGRTDLVAKGGAHIEADARAKLKRRRPWGQILGAVAGVLALGLGGLLAADQYGLFDPEPKVYAVKLPREVNGLQVGERVEFSGVEVGEVAALLLDPADPSITIARLSILRDVPVRTDSTADFLVGDSGVEGVRISAGAMQTPMLRTPDGEGRSALIAAGKQLYISPGADPCVQARADWEALAQSNDVALITAYRENAPETCTVQRSLAQSRIDGLNAAQTASTNAESDSAEVDRAFAGSWVAVDGRGGPCGRLPWRFERDGAGFTRFDVGGDKDSFALVRTAAPTLLYTETGMRIVAAAGQLKVIPADGGEPCLLRRQ